jgi:hypothetical protein
MKNPAASGAVFWIFPHNTIQAMINFVGNPYAA